MFLAELKENAKKILAIPDGVDGFTNVSFTTSSGGCPSNKTNIVPVSKAEDFVYNTTACGEAYRGEIVILCKKTETVDSDGDAIYITPDNTVFVYKYYCGSPSSFDSGKICEPS